VDARFGLVQIQDAFYCPCDGFSMGSPAAAGGANILGGITEFQLLSEMDLPTQYEISAKTLLMRWMDDNLQIFDRSLSRKGKKALRRLAAPGFYGGKLDQKSEGREADTAFGFKLAITGGVVRARAARPFANERAGEKGIPSQWPHVHGGTGYGSRKAKAAAAAGRLFRELDMTNGTEEEAADGVRRTVAEMCRAGVDRRVLSSAVRKVAAASWVKFDSVLESLNSSDQKIDKWCVAFDWKERIEQMKDRTGRAMEACLK
jgi:hypothetical protein